MRAAVIGSFILGGDGALVDPIRQDANLRLAQGRLLERHERGAVAAFQRVNERTILRLAWKQDGAAGASLANKLSRIEPQLGLVHLEAMTLDAVLGQQGLDVANVIDVVSGAGQRRQSQAA